MLMGNGIAGGLVVPNLEILDNPVAIKMPDLSHTPGPYPACVTRTRSVIEKEIY